MNPYEVWGRSLKVMRLALILEAAGLRRSQEVWEMDDASRRAALEVLGAGLGKGGQTASRETWMGVARLVGWLGEGRAVKL